MKPMEKTRLSSSEWIWSIHDPKYRQSHAEYVFRQPTSKDVKTRVDVSVKVHGNKKHEESSSEALV